MAECTFKHKQVISSVVDGGKRLLNQMTGSYAYEPQGDVRLVSHVFSTTDHPKFATVMTFTSKNELITFDVSTSARRPSGYLTAAEQDANETTAEDRTMFDMVAQSSRASKSIQERALVTKATETERV